MTKEEIKVMIKDCVYSEDGITYMSDKQHNNYIDIIKQLQQENNKYKEVIDKAIEYIKIYRSYQKIDNKDYLKSRDEIGCLDIYQVDELLDILKGVK